MYEENDILKLEEFHIFDKKNHGPLFQLLALFILDFNNIMYWNDISSRPGKIFFKLMEEHTSEISGLCLIK